MKRRVVITGLGAITPLGNDVNTTWNNVKQGKNGIDTIKNFDTSDINIKLAAEVKNFNVEDYMDKKAAKRMDKFTQFAVIASNEAVKDSKLDTNKVDSSRFGVIFASGIGGIETIDNNSIKGTSKGYSRISPFFIPSAIINIAAGQIAINHQAKGSTISIVTACSGGTDAVGQAYRNIKDGYLDVAIAGGAEAAVGILGLSGFMVMRALSKSEDKNRASIPFDAERNGFVMGEGAGALILEDLEHAKKRGAHIYCEVVGYGTTCDAHHITAPIEDGSGAIACLKMATKDIDLNDIDYINAHGTSTPLNDKIETKAIKTVLGDKKDLNISSTKSMTGHLLGASGAIEAIFIAKAIEDKFVPPTINYKEKDPLCDLNITPNVGVKKDIKIALSNSLGFGGHNAIIAFRKFEE